MKKTTPTILGLSALYHDSAAVLLRDGEIMAAVQEERFTRCKNDASFPLHSIAYCLEQSGVSLTDLDAVVFYDKPFLTFERLLETYYQHAPLGLTSFLTAVPNWLKEKLFLKKQIRRELTALSPGVCPPLFFTEHHAAHAASAFYPSGFHSAAILTVDGVGEWATTTIQKGIGNQIIPCQEIHFPNSIGLFYSAFTAALGFKINSGEYKLMGLAPYGEIHSKETKNFKKILREKVLTIHEDGSIVLHRDFFQFETALSMYLEEKFQTLFGFSTRDSEAEITQQHANLALAVQETLEEILFRLAKTAKQVTNCNRLCMAGGVALNASFNGKLLESGMFDEIFIQPAAGDAGGALGAALLVQHLHFDSDRPLDLGQSMLKGSFLGPEFSQAEVDKIAGAEGLTGVTYKDESALTDAVADLLQAEKIIGWFQGRMEWGPRALGHRSILADPRNSEMQSRINQSIKFREDFRPFAPAILQECQHNYFLTDKELPYMQYVLPLRQELRHNPPSNYNSLTQAEKLAVKRSNIPAVTHLDYTARLQTISQEKHPLFHQLLSKFKEKTGVGVILNTSFNVRGEPIVCTPLEAINCFRKTKIDVLVMGLSVFLRTAKEE